MNCSIDSFYAYLYHYLNSKYKNILLRSFNTHGSRLLKDIIIPSFPINESIPKRLLGQVVLFDQEPIEMSYFQNWIDYDPDSFPEDFEYHQVGDLYKHLTKSDFIFRHFSGVYNPILCHSERNSDEVKLFEKNHFESVHYFFHGFIARDWFRHWKHYNMKSSKNAKRFGMYARDASGSRKYRLDLLRNLIPYKHHLYYKLQKPIYQIDQSLNEYYEFNSIEYDANSSAQIVPEDTALFNIQIVPETLFNTTKTHLTEKIFKPIVMKQPFIIVGCPNSLKYLKDYGFKTFDYIWNEHYDQEMNPKKRMDMIISLIDQIAKLSDEDFRNLILETEKIVKHNHKHFFSEEFEKIMLDEMHENFKKAFINRNKKFVTMPGGTWFMYLSKLQKQNLDITDFNRRRINEVINYLEKDAPLQAHHIKTIYKDLLK